MHIPVLLNETIEALNVQSGDRVIDGTYGGGGHTAALLERIGEKGALLAVDWNEHAVRGCTERYAEDPRVTCANGNFANLPEIVRLASFDKAQGLLLDLGVSSDELEHSGRGFSFRENEPLFMTYNDAEEPVRDLLRRVSEEELTDIIKTYGEERHAAKIAHAIKEEGRKNPIETSAALATLIERVVPRRGRLHPATRTFMALRIAANKELENVAHALHNIPALVAPGGRAAIISFHSLEDRLVKKVFKEMEKNKKAKIITKKPIRPTREETLKNPRSRSAKLRAIILTN